MINPLLMILFIIHAGYSMKGGFHPQPGEFTYIASVRKGYGHYCNGLIIHEKYIITVAHRIAEFIPTDLNVFVGTKVMYSQFTIQHSVKEVYLHPSYKIRNFEGNWDDAYYEHDIAVLRLEQSLIWSPSVSKVPLVNIEHDWDHRLQCIIIAWNFPKDYRSAMILKWESIKWFGNEFHQQWASYLGENQKFFSDRAGTATIEANDIGSPLVCGNSIIGLVEKGEQVPILERPSITMSIAPYLEFIDDVAHDGLYRVGLDEFPYVASIWYNDTYACGGFIVDDTHVATVGHFVMGFRMDGFKVSVGYPLQSFSLVNITIHPNYRVETTEIPPYWYIDHDFALLTLDRPILRNQWTSPLPLAQSNDFYAGQLCEVLRWKYRIDGRTGTEIIQLMSSHVKILNEQCSQPRLDPNLQVPSFWGESRYQIPIADHKDVGNPLVCDGNPVGFLIQAIPFDEKTTGALARFLKIHPYIEFGNSIEIL